MRDKIVKTCLGIDCPERFSLCCHAGSRSASEPEILLGVPAYYCSKCGKEFQGGECTAGDGKEITEELIRYIKDSPMGVSQWKNHGIKYGYDKFFGIDLEKLEEKKHNTPPSIKTKLK